MLFENYENYLRVSDKRLLTKGRYKKTVLVQEKDLNSEGWYGTLTRHLKQEK